jgi:predicted GNAT family acetyltransferase
MQIEHDPQRQCFTAPGGAVLSYTVACGHHVFDHTEVPPALRGQGVAGQLAQAAFEHARAHGWKVQPACSYIDVYLKRHPEYRDLLADS